MIADSLYIRDDGEDDDGGDDGDDDGDDDYDGTGQSGAREGWRRAAAGSDSYMKFSNFRSLWTMPSLCKYDTASSICLSVSAAFCSLK